MIVPEGIAVELTGFGLMGGKEARIADVSVLPGSPVVRVRAFALMGGVVVRSRSVDQDSRRCTNTITSVADSETGRPDSSTIPGEWFPWS